MVAVSQLNLLRFVLTYLSKYIKAFIVNILPSRGVPQLVHPHDPFFIFHLALPKASMLSWPDFLLEVQLLWSTILEISFNRKELLSPSSVLSLSSFSFFVRHMKATESGGMRLHSPSGGWYSEAVFGGSLLCSSLCPLSLYTFPSGIYRH